MKRPAQLLALFAAVVGASVAHAEPPKNFEAVAKAEPVAPPVSLAQALFRAGGVVASMDVARGVPSLLWAVGVHPAQTKVSAAAAARSHLVDFAPVYALGPGALAAARVVHVHDTGRGGIVVTFRQRMGGVELFESDMKLLLRRNLELVAISGSLDPKASAAARGKAGAPLFRIDGRHALALAFGDLFEVAVGDDAFASAAEGEGGYARFELRETDAVKAAGVSFSSPARVKRVYYRLPRELAAAYFVELHAGRVGETSSEYVRYVVAGDDGRLLQRRDLTAYDSYSYRVWADSSVLHAPLHGPQADYLPHPAGAPDGSDPAFIPPSLVTMGGFNTNPDGESDPWLPANATQTVGNNVDAYADLGWPDGYSNGDIRPVITATGVFDRTFDTSVDADADEAQIMAATTQLFYLNNWLHDWWYDSGFDEAAGNAQNVNFGRGGLGGDALQAQAQDYSGTNNANMQTPADGASPIMQMFVFDPPFDVAREVVVTPGGTFTELGISRFGPDSFDVSGPLVLVDDGTEPVSDGCEPPQNAVSGSIVLVDRGGCYFDDKVHNAEGAGAAGVLIANHTAGAGVINMSVGSGWPLTIPAMMVSFEDGVAIKSLLAAGPVSSRMTRVPGAKRDGTIDNMVSAHEWGHYLHGRLAGGGNRQARAQGEGWGDFLALHTQLREGDALDGTYAAGVYVPRLFGDSGYFGIRRVPYSVDFTKNALTFRHISDGEALPTSHPLNLVWSAYNSEVHNAGEIWGTMMLEAYVALLEQTEAPNPPYDFAEAKRRMSDYVVAAMLLTPVSATFTEARDAIVAAAFAADPADALRIAEAFARRGAGSCAVSPPRYSNDLVGVTEGFELAPRVELGEMRLDDSVSSCDDDGALDGNETGRLAVTVHNAGLAALSGAELTVATSSAGASFPAGASVLLADIPPLESATVEVEIALSDTFADVGVLEVEATLSAPGACESTVLASLSERINVDGVPATTETAEAGPDVWTKHGEDAELVWSRVALSATAHEWQGVDFGAESDTALESPDLEISSSEPFVVSFEHAYDFEWDATPTAYDGGVIELSRDAGQSWTDISTYVDPGYSATLSSCCGNPLAGRAAFGGQSGSYPALEPVTLDLGAAFAGETVRLRFRIGTDAAVGAEGWRLDNVAFAGITNAPFIDVAPDAGVCIPPPACGDGNVDDGEECDDGEDNSDTAPDACRTSCQWPSCGDGVTDSREACDDGADNSDTAPDACRPGCLAPRCGDGVVDSNEDCDDGVFNSFASDACRPSCAAPSCGDGVRDYGELCDDGNDADDDTCTSACTLGPLTVDDGAGNQGGAPAAAASAPGRLEAEGCGCVAPGRAPRAPSSLALGLAGLALAGVRRRRR